MNSGNKTPRRFSGNGDSPADAYPVGAPLAAARSIPIDVLIVAIGALLVLVTAGGLAFSLWRAHEDALAAAEENTRNLAQLAESQAASHFAAVDLALRSVSQDLASARPGRGRDLGDMLRERLQQVPFVQTLLVIDAGGMLIRATSGQLASTMGDDRSEREYFSVHRGNPSSELHVSKPFIGRVRGEWAIALSRRLTDLRGRFAGVAVAIVGINYFERMYASIPVGQRGFVALLRRDEVQLLRAPRIESLLGRPVPGSRIFSEMLPRADAGMYRDVSPVDRTQRIYAYRLVPGRNVVVVAARGVDEILSGWRTRAWIEASYAAGLIAAALLLVWLALREARRQETFHRGAREREAELSRRETLQRALRESEARLSRMVESAMDAIVTMDEANRIVFFNAAAERAFRRSAAEVSGQPIEMLMPERYRAGHHEHIRAFGKSGVASRNMRGGAIFGLRSDGSEFPVEASISQIQIGGRMFFTAILRDITERRRAEKEILELNADLDRRVARRTEELEAANRELEAFSYSVSHDLRAPLRHIGGFAKLLLDPRQNTEETRDRYVQIIARSVERMNKLIDDLLALSRASRVEMQMRPVDLDSLVEEVREESMREAGDRRIDWRVLALPRVVGDASLLRIVFLNLLSNAVKFTSGREDAAIEIGARSGENGEAVVYVKDNGAGFDMRHADKLFGVFQRLHRQEQFEGTGIGLATAHRIVHRHGGRIWAEAENGRGATFFMTLKTAQSVKHAEDARSQ